MRIQFVRGRRKICALFLACAVLFCTTSPIYAKEYREEAVVELPKDSKQFVFTKGTGKMDVKDVMPGDTVEQVVTITNKRSETIELYLSTKNSSGNSQLLDVLRLKITGNTGAVLYEDTLKEYRESGGINFGTLTTGKSYKVTLTLTVPTSVNNSYVGESVGFVWDMVGEAFERSLSSSSSSSSRKAGDNRDTDTIDIDNDAPPTSSGSGGNNGGVYIPNNQTPQTELPKTGGKK